MNLTQNEQLVQKVIEYAGLSGRETVVDLYAGVGNFTLPLSRSARAAIGVESSVGAVEFAEENARVNGTKGAAFMPRRRAC